MGIRWFEKGELVPAVLRDIEKVEVLLDIGCGIRPQNHVKPIVHICCEPFEQYVDHLQKEVAGRYDCNFVILKASWADAVKIFPPKSVDSVFLLDVIEHLEKEEAARLLKATEKLAKRQIVIFTPLGFLPQHHSDGKDAWGLDGGVWQEHRSGWEPNEFESSWEIYASREFHVADNMGSARERAHGAFWALKTYKLCGFQDRVDAEKRKLMRMLMTTTSGLKPYEVRIATLLNRGYWGFKKTLRKKK